MGVFALSAAACTPPPPPSGSSAVSSLLISGFSALHLVVAPFAWCSAGDVGAIEAAPAVEEPLEVGPQRQYSLDDFELIRVIGRGSYAKVLMVELRRTRRIYAMKVIKKALVTDDEDIDWVQTEKHVFETASNHPFLVGLHSCFQTPSRLFFVIEFVRGGDLMFHMQRQRRLPEEHARFYSAEISLALNFLHEKVGQHFAHLLTDACTKSQKCFAVVVGRRVAQIYMSFLNFVLALPLLLLLLLASCSRPWLHRVLIVSLRTGNHLS